MLTVNRAFVEHIYRYNVVLSCVFDELEKLYGISDTETPDLFLFLAGKDAFADSSLPEIGIDGKHINGKTSPSKIDLENHITEWKASKPSGEELPHNYWGVNLINTLSEILGVQLYVEKESEQQRATKRVLSETSEQAGLLSVMPSTIMTFYYLIHTWREKKLYKSRWLNEFETLKNDRKHLNVLSWLILFFEKHKAAPESVDYVERSFNKGSKTFGTGRFLQLLYGRGYVFDETISKERDLAFQWLQSIYEFAKSYEDNIADIEIMLFVSQGSTIDDPYYTKRRDFVEAALRRSDRKRLSEEFEDADNDDNAQGNDAGKNSKKGERHSGGTWHTNNNTTSDFVWAEHFSKCWKKLRGLIIEKIVFPDKYNIGKKKERAISMLEASMLYKVLESNGLARPFWEHGTTSSFVNTLPKEADIYRQNLGKYIFLIEVVKRMEEIRKENGFYLDTKRARRSSSKDKSEVEPGNDSNRRRQRTDWKRDRHERVLLCQDPMDLVLEFKSQDPDLAEFLTVNTENYNGFLLIMNAIEEYSWCKGKDE